MAILWRTRGTFGPDDSIDYGTSMELLVQVLLEDELTAKFPMPGYYYVPELNSRDAGFLFEPSNPRPR